MIKRFFAVGLASIMSVSMIMCASAAAADCSAAFDFSKDSSGFTPIFADYPNIEGVEKFYEFRHEYGSVPIDGAGNGLFISGNNHSDDLFMGYVKMLDGFVPGRAYHFKVSFKLATNVEAGLIGIGGSPGESVTVKCGVTTRQPQAIPETSGSSEYFRMNIDIGAQESGGRDMVVVGDMVKDDDSLLGQYEFKTFQAELDAAANSRGEVFLIIGTDSGFEATTSYYLDDISVSWEAAEQRTVTRAQAARMLFQAADRAGGDPADCTFRDVTVDDPDAEAIAWAQQNGYLYGYGDGRFGPEDSMTAEQAMVMIYRFFGSPNADLSVLDDMEGGSEISCWAKEAVAWAIMAEIRTPAKFIAPQAPITLEELTDSISRIVVAY